MSGSADSSGKDLPQLFDSGEIATLQRTQEGEAAAAPEVPHPWPVVAEHFPRIAQAIFDLWSSPECDAYLDKLILDDRGGRAGFPREVLRALLDLSQQHQRQFAHGDPHPVWLDGPLSPQRSR
jgi:hypothetical protein